MEGAIEELATCRVGERTISRVRVNDSGQEVYLVERLHPAEAAPDHPNLPSVTQHLTWEDRVFWVLPPPPGHSAAERWREPAPSVETAVGLVRQLGEGLLLLQSHGLCVGECYASLYWENHRVVLHYAEALVREADVTSSLAEARGESPAVTTLAVILHEALTGKLASAPPYVFFSPDRFRRDVPPELWPLVREALEGRVHLVEFVGWMRELEAERHLVRIFPPPVTQGAGSRSAGKTGSSPGKRDAVMEWLLWLVCAAAGIYILYQFD